MTGSETPEEIRAAVEREGAVAVVDAFLALLWPPEKAADVAAETSALDARLRKFFEAGGFSKDAKPGPLFALSCLNAAFSEFCLREIKSLVVSDKQQGSFPQSASFEYLKVQGELEALKALCAEVLADIGNSSEYQPTSSFLASQLLLQQLGNLLYGYALAGTLGKNEVINLLTLLSAVAGANAEYGSAEFSAEAAEQIMTALGVSSK